MSTLSPLMRLKAELPQAYQADCIIHVRVSDLAAVLAVVDAALALEFQDIHDDDMPRGWEIFFTALDALESPQQ